MRTHASREACIHPIGRCSASWTRSQVKVRPRIRPKTEPPTLTHSDTDGAGGVAVTDVTAGRIARIGTPSDAAKTRTRNSLETLAGPFRNLVTEFGAAPHMLRTQSPARRLRPAFTLPRPPRSAPNAPYPALVQRRRPQPRGSIGRSTHWPGPCRSTPPRLPT